MSERKCESCIHYVPILHNEEFDICNVGGGKTKIYKDLQYCQCSGYEPVKQNHDSVNHPSHYTAGGIECIEALKAATTKLTGIEAVCTANAIKYLWRWKDKNGSEDIRKAIWYCERLLKEIGDERTE